MENKVLLKSGKYYHIYNCGINGEDIFLSKNDYERFLKLFEKYINPVCDIYAWVLMKNHFHLLVKIKTGVRYKYSIHDVGYDKEKFDEIKWETVDFCSNDERSATLSCLNDDSTCQCPQDLTALKNKKIPNPQLHFSHFFNAYAKYFNIKYKRHGSLFERPFNRKEIYHINNFRNLVIYIHQNPVHHGFCDHPAEYGWSSYLTIIAIRPTRLKREEVLGWFDNEGNFKWLHYQRLQVDGLEKYLGL